MKLSDYVIDYLVKIGVKHVFLITGGAASHLVDSFHKRKDIKYICVQHEQAAAICADAYSRMGSSIGVVITTSGPGATNLITGAGCSWFDSIPCLYLTGQVNTYEYKGGSSVRQIGFQETDIVSILKPLTKFSHMVTEPEEIRYYLEKAVYLAKSGRPGPVLLDLPMNIQRAEIRSSTLKRFNVRDVVCRNDSGAVLDRKLNQCLKLIECARRPAIVVGGGVRNSHATNELRELAEVLDFPVTVTLCGLDAFDHTHRLFAGFIGVYGQRGANLTVANSDLLIGIGSRFDSRQTGTQPKSFARAARKIIVDIDPNELNRRVRADVAVACDAKLFIKSLLKKIKVIKKSGNSGWLKKVKEWREKYSGVPVNTRSSHRVNPYFFLKALSGQLNKDSVVTLDTGANMIWSAQTLEVREKQRVFTAGGMSPMGYALPAAIGASVCLNKKPVICIVGDGGMQLNIQELQTIKHYQLPVKIFVMKNHAYGMRKQFQEMYFGSRYEATDPSRGYSCPDFIKIGKAYGLKTLMIESHRALKQKISQVLRSSGPVLCDVKVDRQARIVPKLEVGKPIEEQAPYLKRKEFQSNMFIEPY